jgi:hypothetical protein
VPICGAVFAAIAVRVAHQTDRKPFPVGCEIWLTGDYGAPCPNVTISLMTSTTTPPARIIKDAELARAAAGGDRAALAGIYERYARPLHDYCVGLVRDHHDAADCVQDVFCTAVAALPKLRDPEKLRPWLYAIARRTALRALHEQRREPAFDELPDSASIGPGPFAR